MTVKGALVASAVAGFFAAAIPGVVSAKETAKVKCAGINSCKGKAECRRAVADGAFGVAGGKRPQLVEQRLELQHQRLVQAGAARGNAGLSHAAPPWWQGRQGRRRAGWGDGESCCVSGLGGKHTPGAGGRGQAGRAMGREAAAAGGLSRG